MRWVIYYALMWLMVTGIRIAAVWNPKARLWIRGRQNWRKKIHHRPSDGSNAIWFHVSSLGEFEQARPVLEAIAGKQPETRIYLTFFSPSGYEVRKNYALAEVFYLPADLPGAADDFMERIQPTVAVFVKYDFWPGYLNALSKRNIPYIIISAHFRLRGWFTSWSFPPVFELLKKSSMIFLQQEEQLATLSEKGFPHLQVAGDTRVDRVSQLPKESAEKIPEILRAEAPFDLVAGSIWPADEKLLSTGLTELNLRVILAPHDVSETNINRLMQNLPVRSERLSALKRDQIPQVIVVDSIGILAYLYGIARIAYVGGGFGKSIHNILEPAAHGKPVIFGPHHQRFPEAENLVANGAGFCVHDTDELLKTLQYLKGENASVAGLKAGEYIRSVAGGTAIVTEYLLEFLPFTPQS